MAKYENEFSSFPTNKINSLRAENKNETAISEIKKAKEENGIDLSHYIVNATTFWTWEEEIYNTQTYAIQKQQSIYFDQSEPNCLGGDVWIGN